MKKLIIKAFCLVYLIISNNLLAFSQTKIIDYLSSGLNTSVCNVFNPQVTINGVLHTSYAGGAIFNSTYGLGLSTTPQSSPPGATAYVINYNFIPNTKYDITITAIGNPTLLLKTSVVPNFTQFTTNSTTTCSTDNNAYSYLTAGYGQSSNPTSSSSSTYTIPQFTITGNNVYPYLIVWASGGRSNLALDALYISKIVITPTTSPSFSISPSPTSIACGSTTPVTFTATGTNVPSGATVSYLWNLGPNNGWINNGSTAAATIPSLTNSLTLTPSCGAALNTVSAKITVNGSQIITNNVTVTTTPPSYSINGNTSLCSGNTPFTINGLVCNSSILWTAPPSSFGSLSSLTTSPINLTYGGTSGSFPLMANISSCGVTTPISLPVHVGTYTSSDYTLTSTNSINGQPLYWCPNQSYSFVVGGGNPASNYIWTIPNGWSTLYNGGYIIALKSPSSPYPPTGNIFVSFIEPCGTTISLNKFLAYNSSACSSSSPYTISPNPASSSYITIACASLQTYCNIAAVQITDLSGNILSSTSWPYTNQTVQMPIYFLQNGTYIVRTYNGSQWYSNQFLVQH